MPIHKKRVAVREGNPYCRLSAGLVSLSKKHY